MKKRRASYNNRDDTRVTKDICLSLLFMEEKRERRVKKKGEREEREWEKEEDREGDKDKGKEREEPKNFPELGPPFCLMLSWSHYMGSIFQNSDHFLLLVTSSILLGTPPQVNGFS